MVEIAVAEEGAMQYYISTARDMMGGKQRQRGGRQGRRN